MRVAVIDLGSNSTRLLVADVTDETVRELERESRVTRLGSGVDTCGRISKDGIAATSAVVSTYIGAIAALGSDRTIAIATSAVRDAANGGDFLTGLRELHGIETWLLDGETEARLSYAGATAGRSRSETALVIDIGGGSTELIAGNDGRIEFHDSLQLGVVRQTERHITADPPTPAELDSLAADADRLIESSLASAPRVPRPTVAIAVAGTATSLAAIDLALEPYDAARVQGRRLTRPEIESILAELAAVPETERRRVRGLHPDRAPTIVAGVIILLRTMHAIGLESVEVSEHDILWGTALEASRPDGRPIEN